MQGNEEPPNPLLREIELLRRRLAQAEVEKAQAETALDNSETRFRTFLQHAPCVSFLKTREGKLIYSSAGLDRDGSSSGSHTSEDRRSVSANLAQELCNRDANLPPADQALESVEIIPAADGTPHSWLVKQFCVPDESGKLLVGTVAVDISERLHVENELRQSEELQRRIVEAMPGGIVTVGPDGAILQANAEAQRILGFSWQEMSRRFVPDWDPETLREDGSVCPAAEYPVSRCLSTGLPQPPTTIGVRQPGGQVSWAIYTALPIFDPHTGQLAGAVVTFLDITKRLQAEKELEQRNVILNSILDSMAEGVVVADEQGNFLHFNRAATQIAGVGRVESSPDQWAERFGLFLTDQVTLLPADQVPLNRAIRGEVVETIDLYLYNKEVGEGRWLNLNSRPLRNPDGTHRGGVVVFRDVTERHRADEKLKEYAEQLRALSRRLLQVQEDERRFLSRELHDEVGQALTGLKLMLEKVSLHQLGQTTEIFGNAVALIQDLMVRVRGLSMQLRPTLLDDLGLVPALRWHNRQYTARTGIDVTMDLAGLEGGDRLPPEIETAAYRIVQEALTNVARHAQVRSATVEVRWEGETLLLNIEDKGPGFNPNAFWQSSGISGMRERATLLGGTLTVHSWPGKGTQILARIPVDGNPGDIGEV